MLQVTKPSSVEAVLSTCDPRLLHTTPVLQELGITQVDHLRAVARMSRETRNQGIKEEALKRGVSIVEGSI